MQNKPLQLTPGAERIALERQRQIEQEGWTPEHDREHKQNEMIEAAMCYAYPDTAARHPVGDPPAGWPWEKKWWKPSPSRVRNLEIAGALIAAEIDRCLNEEKEMLLS